MGDVPVRFRKLALANQLASHSPYIDFGAYVNWVDHFACVWFWSKPKIEESLQQQGYQLTDFECLPEEFVLDKQVNGVSRRSIANGYLFQCRDHNTWKDSVYLPSDHSLPSVLTGKSWFSIQPPHIIEDDNYRPEIGRVAAFFRYQKWRTVRSAMVAMVGLLLLALTFNMAVVVKLVIGTNQIEQRTQLALESVEPLLVKKNAYNELNQRNRAVYEQVNRPFQVEVVTEFERILGDYYNNLHSWKYDKPILVVTLSGVELSPRDVIEKLTASTMFVSVKAEPNPDATKLDVSLVVQPSVSVYMNKEGSSNAD